MRHAVIALLAGSALGLGLWLGDRLFFAVAAAILLSYGIGLWTQRRGRRKGTK